MIMFSLFPSRLEENLVHRLELPPAADSAFSAQMSDLTLGESISRPPTSLPRLVKKFTRSAAGQKVDDPRDARDPSTALRAARYLIKE